MEAGWRGRWRGRWKQGGGEGEGEGGEEGGEEGEGESEEECGVEGGEEGDSPPVLFPQPCERLMLEAAGFSPPPCPASPEQGRRGGVGS